MNRFQSALARRRFVREVEAQLTAEPLLMFHRRKIGRRTYVRETYIKVVYPPTDSGDDRTEEERSDVVRHVACSLRRVLLAMSFLRLQNTAAWVWLASHASNGPIPLPPYKMPRWLRPYRARHTCEETWKGDMRRHYIAAWDEFVHQVSPVSILLMKRAK